MFKVPLDVSTVAEGGMANGTTWYKSSCEVPSETKYMTGRRLLVALVTSPWLLMLKTYRHPLSRDYWLVAVVDVVVASLVDVVVGGGNKCETAPPDIAGNVMHKHGQTECRRHRHASRRTGFGKRALSYEDIAHSRFRVVVLEQQQLRSSLQRLEGSVEPRGGRQLGRRGRRVPGGVEAWRGIAGLD